MHFDRRRFLGATFAAGAAAMAVRSAAQPKLMPGTPGPAPLAAAPASAYRPPLLDEALAALDSHKFAARDRLALVDFSLPSSHPRLQLVNVESGQIEQSWLVAHGKGSDPSATGMLQTFSNEPGSNASCQGAFLAADFYVGQHGRSQRLIGLDPSNSLALERSIVVHGADYVDPALVERQGRIGRSQGCFAVERSQVAEVMQRLGQGRMIYAAKAA